MSTSFYLKAMKLPLLSPVSIAVAMNLVLSLPMALRIAAKRRYLKDFKLFIQRVFFLV
jgi:hypothetical protein